MIESYCGKNCEKCREENNHGCGGCKSGASFKKGDCKIVDCVTEKKLCSCQECTVRRSCSMIQNNTKMYGLERGKTFGGEPVIKKGRGKWFTVLFIATLIEIICTVLDLEFIKNIVAIPDFVTTVLLIISTILYFAACFYLYQFSDDFQKSAISYIATNVLSIVGLFMLSGETDGAIKVVGVFIYIAVIVTLILYNCYLYSACAEATRNIDRRISENWENVKKYFLVSIFTFIGSVFVVILGIPLIMWLALIVAIAAAVGMVIVKITSFVLFFKSMNCCNAIDKDYII